MKTMKNFGMIVLVIVVGSLPVIAQTNSKDSYLANAMICFDKGEYQNARSYLQKYAAEDGDKKIAKGLSTKCISCEEYLSKANAAYTADEFVIAEQFYAKLKALNPKHPAIQELIDKCIRKASEKTAPTSTVESSSKQVDISSSATHGYSYYYPSHKSIFKDDSYVDSKKNNFTAWGFGGGYPWNIVTSFEYRGGGVVGYGLYGEVGIDITSILYEEYNGNYVYKGNNQTEFVKDEIASSRVNKVTFHYAGGLKFYPYKGLFIDLGYGTISSTSAKVEERVTGTPYASLDNKEEDVIREQITVGHGWIFHVGCISVSNLSKGSGGFFSVSGGFAYDVVNKETVPSINIKFGFAW